MHRPAQSRRGRPRAATAAAVTHVLYRTDHFPLPLPADHRFPLAKYARLRERVEARVPDLLVEAPAATDAELARAHDPGYVAAVSVGSLDAAAQRRIGFPWSPAMVERSRRSAGATLAACRTALVTGAAVNLAGGTHHAHRDFGAGFCVFNDAAVAALALLAEGAIARAVIIDLDVHQGDGTASILAGNPAAFTFSMHGRDNYPFRKAAGDLDVELADGTADPAYLRPRPGARRRRDRDRDLPGRRRPLRRRPPRPPRTDQAGAGRARRRGARRTAGPAGAGCRGDGRRLRRRRRRRRRHPPGDDRRRARPSRAAAHARLGSCRRWFILNAAASILAFAIPDERHRAYCA